MSKEWWKVARRSFAYPKRDENYEQRKRAKGSPVLEGRAVRIFRHAWDRQRIAAQLSTTLYSCTAGFVPACGADRSVFHDGIRICQQGGGGIHSRISQSRIPQSHLDGRPDRDSVLFSHHSRGRI